MKRGARRLLLFGLQTVLGLARRAFFIPYARADGVSPPGPPGWVEARFDRPCRHSWRRWTTSTAWRRRSAPSIGGPPPKPRRDQDRFPRLVAAMLCALARQRAPRRRDRQRPFHELPAARAPRRRCGSGGDRDRHRAPHRPCRAGSRSRRWRWATGWQSIPAMSPCPARTWISCSGISCRRCRPACCCMSTTSSCGTPTRRTGPGGAIMSNWGAALLLTGGWRPVSTSRYMATRHPVRTANSAVAALPMPPGARDTILRLCREPA